MLCIATFQPTITTYLIWRKIDLFPLSEPQTTWELYFMQKEHFQKLSHSRCQTLWKEHCALCLGDHCIMLSQHFANFRESRNTHQSRKTKVWRGVSYPINPRGRSRVSQKLANNGISYMYIAWNKWLFSFQSFELCSYTGR